MELSKYLIALFLVIITFFAFGVTFVSLTQEDAYNVSISHTFQGAYTNNSDLIDIVKDTASLSVNITDESKEAKQLEGDYSDPSKSMLKSVKLIWGSFDTVKGLILGVSTLLKIPPVITAIIIAIMIILLVFAFISLVFRYKA